MNKKELPERIVGRFWSIADLSLTVINYSSSGKVNFGLRRLMYAGLKYG